MWEKFHRMVNWGMKIFSRSVLENVLNFLPCALHDELLSTLFVTCLCSLS